MNRTSNVFKNILPFVRLRRLSILIYINITLKGVTQFGVASIPVKSLEPPSFLVILRILHFGIIHASFAHTVHSEDDV